MASDVSEVFGSLSGDSILKIANGGTGTDTASEALTNLGALASANFPSVSVNNEIVLFSGITGKVTKRATITGMLKATSGVIGTGTAGSDYLTPTGDGSGLTGITDDSGRRFSFL